MQPDNLTAAEGLRGVRQMLSISEEQEEDVMEQRQEQDEDASQQVQEQGEDASQQVQEQDEDTSQQVQEQDEDTSQQVHEKYEGATEQAPGQGDSALVCEHAEEQQYDSKVEQNTDVLNRDEEDYPEESLKHAALYREETLRHVDDQVNEEAQESREQVLDVENEKVFCGDGESEPQEAWNKQVHAKQESESGQVVVAIHTDENDGEIHKETIVKESCGRSEARDESYGHHIHTRIHESYEQLPVHVPTRREQDSSQRICQMKGMAGAPDNMLAMMQSEQARDEALKVFEEQQRAVIICQAAAKRLCVQLLLRTWVRWHDKRGSRHGPWLELENAAVSRKLPGNFETIYIPSFTSCVIANKHSDSSPHTSYT